MRPQISQCISGDFLRSVMVLLKLQSTLLLTVRSVQNKILATDKTLTHFPAELLVLHAQPLLLRVLSEHHLLQDPVVLHQSRLQIRLAGQLRPQVLNLIEKKNTIKY